jgi:outer membrane receptor for ferrienterochelin and colicins
MINQILNRRYLTIFVTLCLSGGVSAQSILTGVIDDGQQPVPFANISVKGYNIGTYSNESGEFILKGVPQGKQELLVSSVGYKQLEKTIEVPDGQQISLNLELQKSFEELEEVVITGTRNETKRSESPVIVGVIDKKSLETVQANTLADGLNFQSGLRMETDCQTCGYSQLRMNGLGGAYSQILIDGRPIFSSLMGLYGLEMIPTNIIERIEVVRGGGSAIYGSNAIAGTVNVITKEPTRDHISIGVNGGIVDNQSFESHVNASASKTFNKAGVTLYASRNEREAYDANGDGFSELPKLEGINFGLNSYYKIGKYGTLGLNFNSINEYRRGGNKIELPAHKAEQSEERTHNILMGGLNYKTSLPGINSSMSFYVAGQHTKRKHYTGIDYADAYGNTIGQSAIGGAQYNYFSSSHTFTAGVEYLYDFVNDEIPLYNYLVDQTTGQLGIFLQDEWKIGSALSLLGGVRIDRHNMVENPVLNPRINILLKPFDYSQLRASYSTGFRAPQAFDTDLHIAFAGGGISLIQLDPDLKEERSKSYSFSFNYDRPSEKYIYGFTIEAFHTRLNDAFVLEEHGVDDQGNMILQKSNGGGSMVQGITWEGRLNYNNYIELDLGFTLQQSVFDQPVQWSSELEGSTEFLRTPNDYGFYTLDIRPMNRLVLSLSGIYTGSMLVPHFGGAPGVPADEVVESEPFFDQGIKMNYTLPFKSIQQNISFFGGVKNVFNSYQDDFDTGRNRDSNFVYGPARPRTIFFGISLESL